MTLARLLGIPLSPGLDPLAAAGEVEFRRIITFAGQALGASCISVPITDSVVSA